MNNLYGTALMNCALECSLRRMNRRCRKNFGCFECNECKYFVKRYVDASPNDVDLFMVEAEMRAGSIKATSGNHHIVFIFLILFFLFVAFIDYSATLKRQGRQWFFQQWMKPAPGVLQQQAKSSLSMDEMIRRTLMLVAIDMLRGVDVDSNGDVSCIDAAVLFYKYFPDKSKVCIEWNYNPSKGFNHMFNCVLIDGVWRAIEPQAGFNNQSWWMKDVWGDQYDSSLNKDVTSRWGVLAK